MINLNTQKIIWEQQIQNEYNKYKLFINDNNMPKYKTKYVDVTKTKVSYSMQTLIYQRPVILNINMGVMVNGQNKHCQPALFHEFTHMWDSENLFKNKDIKDRKSVISLYTEYHASQIEFLRFMEFDSLDQLKHLNYNDKFYEFGKEETVFEYYDERCKLLAESINDYELNPSVDNYKSVIDSYMYIFGIKSIYDKYIDTVDFPQVNSIFHQDIMSMYPVLQDITIENLWDILLEYIKIFNNKHICNSNNNFTI